MIGHNTEICVRPSELFLLKSSQRLSLIFRVILFSKFSVSLIVYKEGEYHFLRCCFYTGGSYYPTCHFPNWRTTPL